MQFTNLAELSNAVRSYQDTSKTREGYPPQRIQYTIDLKKAVVEFQLRTKTNVKYLSKSCNITATMFYSWRTQYQDGLYAGNAAIAVSRTAKVAHETALEVLKARQAMLEGELEELSTKIVLIQQLEDQGFSVTKKVA